MFSSHFGGCDPSRRHRKAKNDAFGNTFYFGYDKNKPNTDFPMFYIQFWHHFGEHFSINSGVGFKHSKMQKVEIPSARPATLPKPHHRRGGNQEAPKRHLGGIHLKVSPLVQAMRVIYFSIKLQISFYRLELEYNSSLGIRLMCCRNSVVCTQCFPEAKHTICATF